MKNYTSIIYPGTFDPITKGHEDLIRRASNLFDNVIVAIADNSTKETYYSFDKRLEIAKIAVNDLSHVSVNGFSGLLMNFIKEKKVYTILRGLRALSDFEYEFQLAGMNRNLFSKIETIFMTPSEEFMFISSSMVREINNLDGDVSKFVSPKVLKFIKESK